MAQTPAPHTSVSSVRVLFGLTDTDPTSWDGTVSLSSGTVKAIQGWRFGPEDSTDYSSSWKAATRSQGNGPDMVLENGVVITADIAPDARWSLHTAKGDFSFTLHDVPWGDQKTFLDGSVAVDRVPPTTQLTTSNDDEDFPAIARHGDDIRVAFVRFSHSDRSLETAVQVPKPPDDLAFLARPAGGDQVFTMSYAAKTGTWSTPVAVSPKGEDIARVATAIDGRNRTWVIWSAQRDGNFDLFAKVDQGPEIRVTSDAGIDVNPVAAADSNGRVWIAWQGYRNNNLEVLAAVQNGDRFGPEKLVSFSPASDWDPAIAASANGDVAVAWDTYDKGDYDVYFRRLKSGPGNNGQIIETDPVPAAASNDFEARPSIVFDVRNRLWVAYEVASPRWGKDFGAYDTTGTPLYEDRNIRVKCFDGDSAFTTSSDLTNVLPGPPAPLRRARGARSNRVPLAPNPNMARNRRPNQGIGPRNAALNSSPRLAADSAGGVYLAFRSLDGPFAARSPVGSVWFEHVVYFDGHNWIGPVFLPRTDGLLNERPALLALESGRLLAVSAMDHRQSIPQGIGPNASDRINSDLYAADLRLDGLSPPSPKPELMTLQRERPAAPDPGVAEERNLVAAVRNYRIPIGSEQLRILRGDMHRHTEYSVDGTRDGSLEDAYRYMIDAGSLDWAGCCDNEDGPGHEYFWWSQQKMTDEYKLGDRFVPLFSYEHAVRYPEGHRNILFAKRGIRPVPHLAPVAVDAPQPLVPNTPDTQLLYKYLHLFGGVSVPHTSATDLGTDWRDNDPAVEPVVEIYDGQRQSYEKDDAPRAAKEDAAINGWRSSGTVTAALDKGYRLGFVASSDHYSTHVAFANVLVSTPTREAILDAFSKRHVYASTDDIVADVRSGDHIMGDEFTVADKPSISVKLIGTTTFAKVVIVKDGREAYAVEPGTREVSFTWRDDAAQSGKTSYYYVRGEQQDGQLVWASPMWITSK
jgi:hypothetical protein